MKDAELTLPELAACPGWGVVLAGLAIMLFWVNIRIT
jgi:hypothetical protein